MKRFAILRFDREKRRTYLVTFVRADNAPHAQLMAYKRYGSRRDLFARSTEGKAGYRLAPGYAGHDPQPI